MTTTIRSLTLPIPLRLVAVLCLLPAAVHAADVDAGPQAARYEAPRVVAFGDVHGAFEALVALLKTVGVIDAEGNWQGEETHLVSLGDLTDRGPDSRQVMDLLQRLQRQASDAGGRVHVVLGNHELMNLTGDLRYVSDGELAAYAELGEGVAGLRAAFAPEGPYGRWLLEQPAVVVVNDSVFVHGGLSGVVHPFTAKTLNSTASELLRALLDLRARLEKSGVLTPGLEVNDAVEDLAGRLAASGDQAALPADVRSDAERFVEIGRHPLFGNDGPFWYRGNARCHRLIEQPVLGDLLAAWRVSRVVVGHTTTPDRRVHARLDGRVILADTGMLASHYRGRAAAVVIDGDDVHVVYGDDGGAAPVVDDGGFLFPLDESQVLSQLPGEAVEPDGTWHPVSLDGIGAVSVKADRLSRRARNAALAAVRLDRLLGLNLAAPVASLDDGLMTVAWRGVLSEADRVAAGVGLENPCANGTALDLLYAFDALIGNDGRSAQNIIYDRGSLQLGSIDHGRSFGRGDGFPDYIERTPKRLPAGLATELRRLDEARLEDALGDLLGSRQLRAILDRRDRLLTTWQVIEP